MPDTQRTSREKAKRMHFAAQMLDSEHATADMQQLVTDYLAALDVLEWYAGNNSWVDYNGIDRHHPKIRDGGNRAAAFLASTDEEQP